MSQECVGLPWRDTELLRKCYAESTSSTLRPVDAPLGPEMMKGRRRPAVMVMDSLCPDAPNATRQQFSDVIMV